MSVVAATPTDLKTYVDGSAKRTGLGTQRAVAQSAHSTASNGCGIYAPTVGSLASVSQWIDEVGSSNESWVDTIRTELIAADNIDQNGVYTATSNDVTTALDNAGLGAAPEPIVVPETTAIGVPQTSGFADDPVSLFNGNFVHTETDLEFPGLAASLAVVRTYNSLSTSRIGAFGAGWSSALDVRVEVDDDLVRIHLADGAIAECSPPRIGEAGVELPGRPDMSLVATEDGFRLVELEDDSHWDFAADGRLLCGSMGATRLVFSHDDHGRVERVDESTTGRWVTFEWGGPAPSGLVTSVVASDGRRCEYSYDATSQLVDVDAPSGGMHYVIVDGLMASFVDADGVAMVVNTYDEQGRVLSQRSQFGRTTTYGYESVDVSGLPGATKFDRRPGVRTIVRGDDGVGVAMTHDANAQLLEMVDGTGSVQRLAWDFGRLSTVWDRMRNKTQYRYDLAGRVSSRIDPEGRSTDFEWDELGRLTSRSDRAGNVTEFAYVEDLRAPVSITAPDGTVGLLELDEHGLVTATVDADGVRTDFAYDSDGQLVGLTGTNGGLGHADYDDAGHLIRSIDASGVEVTLEVDPAGRARAMSRAGICSTCEFSPAGRAFTGQEPGDVTWANEYGVSGALVAVTDAEGSTVRFEHDTCGNVTGVVAPDGEIVRQEYDAANRLVELVQPGGATSKKRYDLNGESISVTDPTGRTWRREVDALSRTIRRIEPDGATTDYTYHPNGELATTTLPDGRRWRSEVDALGRTIAVIRPDGARASMTYTPAGRVAARTSPAGRVEAYEYDRAGRCIAIVTDGVRRELSIDEQGRVTEMVDPDGRLSIQWGPHGATGFSGPDSSWTADYDDAGRLSAVIDGAGVARTFEYDGRGLVAAVNGSPGDAGAASRFGRDVRGRIDSEQHPGGRTVSYGYGAGGLLEEVTDAEVTTRLLRSETGEITGLRQPDGSGWNRKLDQVGREVERTDADGRLIAESDYDIAGRLTKIRNADGEIGLLWDDDDLLVARIGGAAPVEVERDADGWLVAATGADGVREEYERDQRGHVASVRRGDEVLALDPGGVIERDLAGRMVADRFGRVIVYDLAGRVSEVTDADGTTSYGYHDASGLLATIDGSSGVSRFDYDRVGRLERSERPDGTVIHQYDLAGRRVLDRFDTGRTTEFVWDRAGSLTAMIETTSDGRQRSVGIERDALGIVRRVAELDPSESSGPGESRRDVWGKRSVEGRVESLDLIDGGVWFDDLAVFAHRCYDATTRQWLSPDPLPTVPGTPGSGSGYTYNWLDPVNYLDPSGLRPLSDEEFAEWEDNYNKGPIDKVVAAVPWDVVAAVAVVAVGVALVVASGGTAAPFLLALGPGAVSLAGATGAGILIGAGVSAGVGLATGNFSWNSVAVGGILGGVGGFAGAGTSLAFQGASAGTRVAVAGASSGIVDSGSRLATGQDITVESVAVSFGLGSAGDIGSQALNRFRARGNPAPGSASTGSPSTAATVHSVDGASPPSNVFPRSTDDLTEQLGVDPIVSVTKDGTPRHRWHPNERTRITMESHPEGILPGDPGFNPRHHGEHYHVQVRPDSTTGWNNPAVTKSYPPGYTPGSGTGFVPGEVFPGGR